MNKFINKLVEVGVIQNAVVGEEFVLTEDFSKVLEVEINNLKSITNYCIDVPSNNLKGAIPYVDSVSAVSDVDDNPTDELDVEIKLNSYELNQIMAYIPVNGTIQALSPEAFKTLVSKVLAKEFIRKLNYKASQLIKQQAKNVVSTPIVSSEQVVDNMISLCYGAKNGFILADSLKINDLLNVLDKDLLQLLEVKMIPVENLGNCVIFGDFNELCYLHKAKEMSVQEDFLKNVKNIFIKEYNTFVISNPNSFAVIELV